MRRWKLSMLFILIPYTLIFGQNPKTKVYQGTVLSATDKQPLEDVVCQALDAANNITSYAFSATDGSFSLNLSRDTYSVQFKILGYTTQTLSISQLQANQKVLLQESSFSLQEVVVRVPPIQSNKDTLKYNVASFKSQNDRYVADILKKLPGIKIAENGAISYMGEAINKFYIEGKDLLGGQYNIATNNLDVDAISSVEVLQNNQHIKALKNVEFDRKAAINLKLKKTYRLRPFGEAQLGLGGTPLRYEGNTFLTHLGNKVQTLTHLKGLNTGNYLLDELDNKLNLNDLFSYEPLLAPVLTGPSPRSIPLPSNRYLFNKTALASSNILIPLSESSDLKVNVAYGLDKANQAYNLLQELATAEDYLLIKENTKLKNNLNTLRTSATYEHNSFKQYLKNEVVYFNQNTRANSYLSTNDTLATPQQAVRSTNSTNYFENNFQGVRRLNNDKTIKLHSFFRYQTSKDKLLTKREKATELDEHFQTDYLVQRNRISSTFNLFSNPLDIGFITTYKQKSSKSDLDMELIKLPELDIKPSQKVKAQHFQVGIDPDYQIRTASNRLSITLKTPLLYSRYKLRSKESKKQTDEKVIFTPSLSTNWMISHQWETYAKIGCTFDYASDLSLLNSPFFTNYRTLYIPANSFNNNKSIYTSASLRYKDIVSLLFFNLNILFRSSKHNYTPTSYNTEDYSYISTVQEANRSNTFFISSDISKTFSSARLTLSLTPSYTRLNSSLIQQDIALKNTHNQVSLSTKIEWKGIPKVSLNHQALGKITWSDNKLSPKTYLKSLTQQFGLYFFPTKTIDLATTADYIIYEKSKGSYSKDFFLDLKGSYHLKSIELGFRLTNLFNRNLLSTTQLSSINLFRQQTPLRKREFLFFFKFKI